MALERGTAARKQVGIKCLSGHRGECTHRSTRLDAHGVLHHIMIQGIERRKMFPFNALGSLLFALCPQCRPNKPGGPPAMSQEIEIDMPPGE